MSKEKPLIVMQSGGDKPLRTPDPVLKLIFGTNDSWPSAC
jgi:hypothetical protein